MNGKSNKISILHFNDVYNIQARDKEPVGGAPRFATALKDRKDLNPLVLFSGDAFNPSIMSSLFKGRQMAAVLNALGVHLAVYGNHDFDFGVDKIVKLNQETTFPWLLSNVFDKMTGRPLAEGKTSHILEWQGRKLGFVGLVEEDWMSTLSTVDPEDVTYLDYVTEGRKLAKELRDDGAEYVIALTHMRWPNDTRLAEEVEEIDIVLGGHDHDFHDKIINGKHVIKSGTDFRYIGQITLTFQDDGKVGVEVEKVVIDSSIKEDEQVKNIVESFTGKMSEKHKKVLGKIEVDLDGRFGHVRTQETNMGNFIADIMLSATQSDVTVLNAGTLRSDRVHQAGEFRIKDMIEILPFGGSVCVVEVTGDLLHKTLEAGVSKYPAHEGRFPQVAGMTFTFDPSKPAGKRIDPKDIKVEGQSLDLEKKYKLACTNYVADGRDGYEVVKNCKQLVNEEEGPPLHSIIRNHFTSMRVLKGEKKLKYGHRQAIMAISRMRMLVKVKNAFQAQTANQSEKPKVEDEKKIEAETAIEALSQAAKENSPTSQPPKPKSARLANNIAILKRAAFQRQETKDTVEKEEINTCLAPKIEGRITIIGQ